MVHGRTICQRGLFVVHPWWVSTSAGVRGYRGMFTPFRYKCLRWCALILNCVDHVTQRIDHGDVMRREYADPTDTPDPIATPIPRRRVPRVRGRSARPTAGRHPITHPYDPDWEIVGRCKRCGLPRSNIRWHDPPSGQG